MTRFQLFMGLLVILILAPCNSPYAAEKKAEAPPAESVTTQDPGVPVEELQLMLKPLPKSQLLIEAEAWQALVQAKAEQIARAEIIVKRQNKEIEKTEKIKEEAGKARQQLEAVKALTQEAKETGDTDAMAKADVAAREAQDRIDQVRTSVDEASEAAAKTAEMQQEMPDEIKQTLSDTEDAAASAEQAVEAVGRTVGDARNQTGEELRAAADQAHDVTGRAVKATGAVEEEASDAVTATRKAIEVDGPKTSAKGTESALDSATDEKKEQKVELLEQIAQLREDRTVLLDQFKAVIEALETKTDDADTETLAKITDYKLYASAVSGIQVDVKDATSTWLAIKTWLMSEEGGYRWLINILTFVGILIVSWIVASVFSSLIHHGIKRVPGRSKLLEDFLVKATRWVVLTIGLIMALAALEVSVGPLLALVGAAGFAIAFALQDSLSNFANGLMILLFKPFDVGHIIETAGVTGKVDSLNLVSTTVKTFDNRLMVIPNNKVWQDVIANASAVTTRRVDLEFGIGYNDDIDKVQAIIEEVVKAHPKVLEEPKPVIRVNTLGESSVNFIVRPWANKEDRMAVYWDLLREIKKRFDAEGIGIPFPQRDVHLYLKDTDKPAISKLSANEHTEEKKQEVDELVS